MYPGQLDILESTYLPEVFKEETEWYWPGPGFL
jgi:hypothetical protein